MKRILPLILIFVLALTLSAAAESSQGIGATNGTCGNNLTWSLDNGTLTISGTGSMTNYSSSSGAPWETRKSDITKVVVSSGATSIGNYAFFGCSSLTSVSLPSGLKTIGDYSFNGCSKLKSISFPSTLTSLGNYAFHSSGLSSVSIPSRVTSMGYECFSNSYSLTSVVLSDSVASIGHDCFYSCTSLASVTLSSSLSLIPSNCFFNCSSLSSITIPEGITSLENAAFGSNIALSEVYLPLSMESIASSAFGFCEKLSDVYYPGTKAQAEAISVGTGNTNFSSATWHFSYSTGIPKPDGYVLTLPAGTKQVQEEAFMGVAAKTVIIPSGCTVIGARAFANSSELKYVSIPVSVKTIADTAFSGCSGLTIYGKTGSAAEKFAADKGFGFIAQ